MGDAATYCSSTWYCWEGNPDTRCLERPVEKKPSKRRIELTKKFKICLIFKKRMYNETTVSGCIVRVVIVVQITEIVMSVFTSRTNYNQNRMNRCEEFRIENMMVSK